MRRMCLQARGVAAWLGFVGVLGFSGAAWAKEPLGCFVQNPRLSPADSCLTVTSSENRQAVLVGNNCDVPVTLTEVPLQDDACRLTGCTAQLESGQQAFFSYSEVQRLSQDVSMQDSYRVKIGDGEEQTLTLFADIRCSTFPSDDEGCAAAPGALAALGVMLLAVPVVRRRRRG
ncbi:MXAN_0125 family MYXO-CTERM protein [Pyxidicoccus trucidator]|uniref:MXAN_0125 family MYXO-CTERM protein n=1 Tax=Pyxidicoccus trucidator TaxID=2709662 RepID=UPI0013D91F17|nr:MXAN_0125 family MYXO-CTERM protein [Pyxidicoccus trucidator]